MSLYQYVKNHHGATITNTGEILKVNHGYIVSLPDMELVRDLQSMRVDQFEAIVSHYLDLIRATPLVYLGLWVSEGRIYFDLSEVITDKETAIRLGMERNQIAIFDNNAKQCIYL